MRIVIHGMGAIGGVVAAALSRAGHEVVGIARGGMLEAVRRNGLRLHAPGIDETLPVAVTAHPGEIDWRPDDVVLLCVKGQDTADALVALRDAGVTNQPVFCAQNGVENERAALRFFPNVHGVTVMMPAVYLDPGEVGIFAEPRFGIFDIGRYPAGLDSADEALKEALEAANIACFLHESVMASKYGKLLVNMRNALKAALGGREDTAGIGDAALAEARAAFAAAGIAWDAVDGSDPRRGELLRPVQTLPGVRRPGSSTNQSLIRGTPRIESDYINGEIALLGRLHGVPVPVNAALARIAARMAREAMGVGSVPVEEIEAEVARS